MRPFALALAACLLASPHLAAQEAAPTGFALPTFAPTPSGDRFFGVPDGRVRGLFEVYGGALMTYGYRPLSNARTQQDYIEHQLYAHFDVGIAVGEAVLLRGDLPVAVAQLGKGDFEPAPQSGEFGDARLTLRINWLEGLEHVFAAGTQVDVYLPSGAESALSGDRGVRAHPMLNASGQADLFAYTLSLGYVFRKGAEDAGGRVGGAFTLGAGFAVLLAKDAIQIGPEIYGNTVTSESLFASRSSPFEALLGAKFRSENVLVGVGLGTSLTSAPGVPDLRTVMSIAYVPDERVLDSDSDGVDDDIDRCPTDPGFEKDGCPPPDPDGDTIRGADDACPSQPGLVHIDPTKNGCPPDPNVSIPGPTKY